MQKFKLRQKKEIKAWVRNEGITNKSTPLTSPVKSNKNTPIKAQSNKQLIKNALTHVCLAGPVNELLQTEVLQVII